MIVCYCLFTITRGGIRIEVCFHFPKLLKIQILSIMWNYLRHLLFESSLISVFFHLSHLPFVSSSNNFLSSIMLTYLSHLHLSPLPFWPSSIIILMIAWLGYNTKIVASLIWQLRCTGCRNTFVKFANFVL